MSVLTGISSLVGGCCAIVMPLSANSANSSSGGDHNEVVSVDSGAISSTISKNQNMSFEQIGHQMNSDGRNKQGSETNSVNSFPGKDNLKKIILENLGENNLNGKIHRSEGQSCLSPAKGSVATCGYLGLSNDKVEYKLQVKYEKNVEELAEGRVFIVRHSKENEINYGDNKGYDQGQGKAMVNSNGESFRTLIGEDSSEWDKITTTSFVVKESKRSDSK